MSACRARSAAILEFVTPAVSTAPVKGTRALSARSMPDMPLDVAEQALVLRSLTNLQLGVYFRLLLHVWLRGELPLPLAERARIGGVSPRAFATMVPAFEPFFDRDPEGRWHHYDLEAARVGYLRDRGERA